MDTIYKKALEQGIRELKELDTTSAVADTANLRRLDWDDVVAVKGVSV